MNDIWYSELFCKCNNNNKSWIFNFSGCIKNHNCTLGSLFICISVQHLENRPPPPQKNSRQSSTFVFFTICQKRNLNKNQWNISQMWDFMKFRPANISLILHFNIRWRKQELKIDGCFFGGGGGLFSKILTKNVS